MLIQENEIVKNNEIIASLDFIIGKGKYAKEINADVASLSKDNCIYLKIARHPLIDKEKVVANDFSLDLEKRIIIISGPNAGGKTVSLKTVGVLILMNQCGLAIPCQEAKLSIFNHIYIDIGDNQSLSDNLSTFSAHMSQVGEIISKVKGKDLVLLDELGTGTDPKEGEAIAYSVTKYLKRKNCLAMISSHFESLKELAFLDDNLINSSMIFDEDRLTPTYLFKQGVPGKSYALDVANRYGINEEIISDAKKFISSKNKNQNDELTSTLLKLINESTKKEKLLEDERKILEKERKNFEAEKNALEKRKDNLLQEVNDEKERLINKTKKEIDEIVKILSSTDLKLHEAIELKKKIEDLQDDVEIDTFNETLNIGDYVSIPSLNMFGRLVSISGNKGKIMSSDGFSFECPLDKLHRIEEKTSTNSHLKKINNYDNIIKSSVSLECNLIGLRVDEAKAKLIKYLDDVRLRNFHQVRIIHGYGSGALRKMTHEVLKSYKDITYRLGGEYEGGAGATVVSIK